MSLPTYSYDEEADVLYISFSPGEKATTAVDLPRPHFSNRLADRRDHLVQVTDDGVVGFGDDRRFGVIVDGNNIF